MGVEIERKFLVDEELIKEVIKGRKPSVINQGYISNNETGVVRVRTKGKKAYLTIKSANTGISRKEFEYKIPLHDGYELLRTVDKKIMKERYVIPFGEHLWEVDFFKGKLEGLILAEIELESETEEFEIPKWIKEEVSADPQYYNSNLINKE